MQGTIIPVQDFGARNNASATRRSFSSPCEISKLNQPHVEINGHTVCGLSQQRNGSQGDKLSVASHLAVAKLNRKVTCY